MKYLQPIGEADPNAPYKDRNTGGGSSGSRVPAKAIENPQREIVAVLVAAGMTPDGDRVDQLNEAIDLKIDLATGGGSNPLDDLLTLLRARLPVFPEILTADGRFNLSVPSTGTIRIPAGIQFQHRGVFPITTAQQDFATAANKVYHLRYRFTGTPGWSLVDVQNSTYNPTSLPEADATFDSKLDDMLSHRVVTDAGNVATITPLINLPVLSFSENQSVTDNIISLGSPGFGYYRLMSSVYNFARRPRHFSIAAALGANLTGGSVGLDGIANLVRFITPSRYQITYRVDSDFEGAPSGLYVDSTVSVMA